MERVFKVYGPNANFVKFANCLNNTLTRFALTTAKVQNGAVDLVTSVFLCSLKSAQKKIFS